MACKTGGGDHGPAMARDGECACEWEMQRVFPGKSHFGYKVKDVNLTSKFFKEYLYVALCWVRIYKLTSLLEIPVHNLGIIITGVTGWHFGDAKPIPMRYTSY